MRRFETQQINRSHDRHRWEYPTVVGQAIVKRMLNSIGIDFDAHTVVVAVFEAHHSRHPQPQLGRSPDDLFAQLNSDRRQEVAAVMTLLLTAPPPQHAGGFEQLSSAFLIVDGDPFVNHDSLSTAILPRLLDRYDSTARRGHDSFHAGSFGWRGRRRAPAPQRICSV